MGRIANLISDRAWTAVQTSDERGGAAVNIDAPVVIQRVSPKAGPTASVVSVWHGVADLLADRTLPSFVEVLVISALGMFCGFMFLAYALQALVVAAVMAMGTTWGLVLGLLFDRFHQTQI